MLEERDEILEDLGRNFHYNHFGTAEATVVGSGVSDEFLEKLVQALDASPYANQAGPASSFNAGQVSLQEKYSTGGDYKAPQVALYETSQVALYNAHQRSNDALLENSVDYPSRSKK